MNAKHRKHPKLLPKPECRILTANEAAEYLGYSRATAAFYSFTARMAITPIRKGAYDKVALDKALDGVTGVAEPADDYEAVDYG